MAAILTPRDDRAEKLLGIALAMNDQDLDQALLDLAAATTRSALRRGVRRDEMQLYLDILSDRHAEACARRGRDGQLLPL